MKLVKLQRQQVPTPLLFRRHRSVVQQCWVRLHSTSNKVAPAHAQCMPVSHDSNLAGMNQRVVCMKLWLFMSQSSLYFYLKTQHVLNFCERLHTSTNIAQQETTMLAQQCCMLFQAFAWAFKALLHKAIFLATSNPTMTNKNPFKLQRGCYTQATCLATLRKVEGRSTFLATRNATIAVAKWGVTHEKFFLQLATQRLLRCKLQEKLLRVTWP